MAHHALSHRAGVAVRRPQRASPDFAVRFVMDRFLLLPLGAAIAFAWANTAPESYFRFAHALAFPVNEIGMALFLGLVAQETFEAVMPAGALHTWRRWGLPVVGAAGGFAGAAFVYLGYVYIKDEQVLSRAWPIACAIDVAAGYYLLKLICPRSAALPFLVVLAIATDTIGLIVFASWGPLSGNYPLGAVLLAGSVALAALMRLARIRSFWPYLIMAGGPAWVALYVAGVHPALALVPIVPFLPHEPRRLDLFADPLDDDPIHHAEHQWDEAVQIIVFLFGLVNAGVLLGGYDTGTWAVLLAALVGRPLGILLAVSVALAIGLRLPRRVGWRELTIIALASSSGFTLALFFASGLLPVGAVLQQVKLGALATAAGAILALAVARILRVGRFAR